MKLRHAAALALVGWYLLTPLAVTSGKYKGFPDLDSPYSRWTIYHSFDTAKDCEAANEKLSERWLPKVNDAKTSETERSKALMWNEASVCIASDDPRLAR